MLGESEVRLARREKLEEVNLRRAELRPILPVLPRAEESIQSHECYVIIQSINQSINQIIFQNNLINNNFN